MCKRDFISIRSYHRQFAYSSLIYRQQRIFIFKQNNALARCAECDFIVETAIHLAVGSFIIGLVWAVEESDKEFYSQYVADTFVNNGHRKFPFFHKFSQWQNIAVRSAEGTTDIQPGLHRLPHRLLHIR